MIHIIKIKLLNNNKIILMIKFQYRKFPKRKKMKIFYNKFD